jgi:hypothetical protein
MKYKLEKLKKGFEDNYLSYLKLLIAKYTNVLNQPFLIQVMILKKFIFSDYRSRVQQFVVTDTI